MTGKRALYWRKLCTKTPCSVLYLAGIYRNLEIGVPVLGNHVFVLDYLSISMGILVKALPHLRCVAAFTNILIKIMIRYAQK